MNKIHNIIWSAAHDAWVVVAEGTKSHSKSGAKALKVMIALLLISPAGIMAATLPQGGVISVGEGSIVAGGNNQLVIKQTTDKLGVNWQSFNIGADGHVVFDQPGKHSIALNRVIGSDGSAILGKIDANGQVFLINPNGVIFGKDSQVNVGGLVASTLDMKDSDFQAGNFKFSTGSKDGSVINQGTLHASQGGYVALIGKSVKNEGVILAKLGTAALAAGDAVTMDFAGDGLINLHVDKAAIGALVDNQGLIVADGGQVLMTARAANALTETVVNNDGIIQAQTLNMRAGRIMLDGGPVDGTGGVTVGGTLDASAPDAGDGGFIDTSGKIVSIKDKTLITTKSVRGRTGDWLIDPTDFTVTAGTAPSTESGIGASTLESALANSNVTLETSSLGTEEGNLTINGAVSWSANTILTLKAHKSVIINNDVTISGDTGGISINYGLSGDPASAFQINGGSGTLTMNGGNNFFAMNGITYAVIDDTTSLRALSNSPDLNGHYVLAKNINAVSSATWNGGLGFDPIGDASNPFTGVFEGLNHRITNLTIKRPSEDYVGFFSTTNGAKISGLSLTGSVTGNTNVGFLAGKFTNSSLVSYDIGSSSYSLSNFSGTVNGNDNLGGVVGQISGSNLLSVQNGATVTLGSGSNVGGIFGLGNALTGKYLYNTGVISGADNTGGIGGTLTGSSKITWSRNLGAVNGSNNVGGLFGSMANSSVITAWSGGDVYASSDRAGGLIGSSTQNQVLEAYSIGKVRADGHYAGGITGYDAGGSTFNETFSTSEVAASDFAGGLIGYASGATISNSYATGMVTGANSAGLVSGLDGSTLNFVYASGKASSGLVAQTTTGGNTINEALWDMGLSGAAASLYGAGKTNAQMKNTATFNNWGLDLVGNGGGLWRQYDGKGAPLLKFRLGTGSGYTTVNQTSKNPIYAGRDLTANELASLGISNGGGLIFWGAYTPITGSDTSGGNAIRNAGTYALDQMYSDQFGFNLYQPNPLTLTVAKKQLTANAGGSVSKVYDGTTGISFDGVAGTFSGDDLVIKMEGDFDSKNAGAGKGINVSNLEVTGSAASNYEIVADTHITGTVDKATLSFQGSAHDKTYDGSTKAEIDFTDDRIAGDNISFDYTANFSDKNAGIGKTVDVSDISLSGSDADNYTWASTSSTTADIAKAALTVTASGVNKTYDGTSGASVNLADNRFGADDLTLSAAGKSFTDKNSGLGKTITISGINVTGVDAGNYIWNTSAATTADIAKAALNVTATGINKTYDSTTNAGVNLADNRISGDDLSVSAGIKAFSDKNAGLEKSINVSGINVTGADAANYTWNTSAVTSADIAKAALSITASGVSKTYDGTTNASVSLNDDRIGADLLVVDVASKAFLDKNAGTGKTIALDGITVTGADSGNYTWNSNASAIADIDKAILSITAVGVNKFYDGTDWADVILHDNRIGADTLNVTKSSSTFEDKTVGDGKTISVNGITVTGSDANNYVWNTLALTLANILPLMSPPDVTPPVVTPPAVTPPVVAPPINDDSKPTVNHDEVKVINAITSIASTYKPDVVSQKTEDVVPGYAFFLVNLGIKLPVDASFQVEDVVEN